MFAVLRDTHNFEPPTRPGHDLEPPADGVPARPVACGGDPADDGDARCSSIVGFGEGAALENRNAKGLEEAAGDKVVKHGRRRLTERRRVAFDPQLREDRVMAQRSERSEAGRFDSGQRLHAAEELREELTALSLVVTQVVRVNTEIHDVTWIEPEVDP